MSNCVRYKVDPQLPPLDVTAGNSALELSKNWCKTHGLGPSHVFIVSKGSGGVPWRYASFKAKHRCFISRKKTVGLNAQEGSASSEPKRFVSKIDGYINLLILRKCNKMQY